MRAVICGSRSWTDRVYIIIWLSHLKLFGVDTVVHGGAAGADKIAGEEAKVLNFKVEEYPANWNKYGKLAGPIRNRKMLNEGKPDIVVYFAEDLTKSKGTKDLVSEAIERDIPVLNGLTSKRVKDVIV